ncbi:hypothetical protein MEO93_18145 [Dolichospermum sp. ST_sed3]|nr:hypothetical protein [Dolichospermum sp. ST_sed6]MDD1442243.1 hypothetical protein [Dolichospermum sp. ST_sed3]MDD1472905.1 hypothetical protein [Dolichospermum sp. ST_sed4]
MSIPKISFFRLAFLRFYAKHHGVDGVNQEDRELIPCLLAKFSFREHQKINYPILWDGHLARPCIISGQDA